MSKVFNFKDQLAIGSKHEQTFLQNYHSPIVKAGEYAYDYKRISDGKKIELKSDTYDMDKTKNFFWERYSDFEKKSPGSIWQSREKRVEVFIYHFPKNFTYFEFDAKELLKFLTPYADKRDVKGGWIFIRNPAWTTAGFTLPREELKDIYTEYKYQPKDAESGATKE